MDKLLRDELVNFLCTTLKKSNILEYELVEFEADDDINFFISPKLKNLKVKDKYKLKFLLYCSDETSLTIYCPTLYKLTDTDSLMYTLNAINIVNSKNAVGKIYLNNKNGSIISYVNRILFNDITNELTVDLLDDYVSAFWATTIEFYEQMKVNLND